ncbi:MAG: TOMM precursor leader peptide-binding protein [Actinomycetota bacterium]|nr:TOMM precursor leader peptide-binding protein [Actinomycetota bacterium]
MTARVRLRPGAAILDNSSDELQIAFPNHTVTLVSPLVVRTVRALLPGLEIGRERASIIGEVATATSLEPEFVDYVVGVLENSQCVYSDENGRDRVDRLGAFDALLGDDPTEAARGRAESTVLVVRPEGVEALESSTADAGISVETVELEVGTTTEKARSLVRDGLDAGPDLAVAWGFPYRLPFARMLNALALEQRASILFGTCEGIVGRVGPFVMPGNSACLECANLRMLANAGGPEVRAVAAHRVKLGDRLPEAWPAHPVFEGAVARFMVLEAAEIAAGRPSSTIGGILEYSFPLGRPVRRPIYRVPRCDACGGDRPRRLAWDVRMGAPEVRKVPG